MPNDWHHTHSQQEEKEMQKDLAQGLRSALALEQSSGRSLTNKQYIKEVVGQIEELPQREIRRTLSQSGVLTDPIALRQTIEASLTQTGKDDHSEIIACLKPNEIRSAILASPEAFCSEFETLILPHVEEQSRWRPISNEEKKALEKSGDKAALRFIRNTHPMAGLGHSEAANGPWEIFCGDVKIVPEVVAAYVSSICNAPKRLPEWKEAALEALGVDLLAIAFKHDHELCSECQRISPALIDRVDALREQCDCIESRAADAHLDTLDRLNNAFANPAQSTREGKNSAYDRADSIRQRAAQVNLRELGIETPSSEDIEMDIEMTETLEDLMKKGDPAIDIDVIDV